MKDLWQCQNVPTRKSSGWAYIIETIIIVKIKNSKGCLITAFTT